MATGIKKHTVRILLAASIVAAILYLSGCIDDGPWKNCPAERFSDEFKRYTMYNAGSYWIYEDSSGNFFDSLILTSQSLDFYPKCDYHGHPFEQLSQTFYSSFFGQLEGVGRTNWEDYYVTENEPHTAGYFINGVQLNDSGGSYHQMKYKQFLDSLEIRGVWYKKVKLISSVADSRIRFYWAESVGVIKKSVTTSLNSDSVLHFELIRYKLN
jgi:hypothetical protein